MPDVKPGNLLAADKREHDHHRPRRPGTAQTHLGPPPHRMSMKMVSMVKLRMARLTTTASSATQRTRLRCDAMPIPASTSPSAAEKTPACSPIRRIDPANGPHHRMNATTSDTRPLASDSSAQGIPSAPAREEGERWVVSVFIDVS